MNLQELQQQHTTISRMGKVLECIDKARIRREGYLTMQKPELWRTVVFYSKEEVQGYVDKWEAIINRLIQYYNYLLRKLKTA